MAAHQAGVLLQGPQSTSEGGRAHHHGGGECVGESPANHRYSWIKNQRSLFVSRTRPCILRRKTIN